MNAPSRERFHEDGYVVVRNAIPRDRIDALTRAVVRIIEAAQAGRLRMKFADKARQIPCGKVTGLLRTAANQPEFGHWIDAEMNLMIERLLDSANVMCVDLALLFAGGGKGTKGGWHRDRIVPGTGQSEADEIRESLTTSCSFQAPLKPNDTFHFLVPSSHSRLMTEEENRARTTPGGPMSGAVNVGLQPGDILFRHPKILHSGVNPQGVERWTFVGDFLSE